jgi:hypothetical protein
MPDTQTGGGSVFGGTSVPDVSGSDPFEDNPETPTPEAQQTTETPAAQPDPAVPATETPTETATEAQEAAAATEAAITFAGREYKDLSAVEQSYLNMRGVYNRTLDRQRQIEARNAELEAYLQQVAANQQAAPTQAAPLPSIPVPAGVDPAEWAQLQATLAPIVGPMVESRVAQAQQQWEAQQRQFQTQAQAQNQVQLAEAAVRTFREAHPDVAPGSVEEQVVADVMRSYGLPLEAPAMERALEIGADPKLGAVIRANPAFAHSDEGMSLARTLASLPAAQAQAVQGATAAQAAQGEAARRAAHVETGGTGAPVQSPPGNQPKDEFDDALATYRPQSAQSVFGT